MAPQNPKKRGNFFGPSNFNFDSTTGSATSKLGSASIFVTIGALEVLFLSTAKFFAVDYKKVRGRLVASVRSSVRSLGKFQNRVSRPFLIRLG